MQSLQKRTLVPRTAQLLLFLLAGALTAAAANAPALVKAADILRALTGDPANTQSRLACRVDANGYTAPETSRHISLPGILFEVGKPDVAAKSLPQVDEVIKAAAALMQTEAAGGFRILIEGHTCDIGRAERNLSLSKARAEAIRTCMMRKGIPAALLETRGWGEQRPCVSNITEENRAKNRRVDFVLQRRLSPAPPANAGPLLDVQLTAREEVHGSTIRTCPDTVALKTGDGIRLLIDARESCHVYALGAGSSGAMQWLLPKEGEAFANYGQWCYFGEEYALPGIKESQWYVLNEPAGAETIYVLASREPIPNPRKLPERLKGQDTGGGALAHLMDVPDAEVHVLKITHD